MNKPIGVFDSGAGGISVLRQARARLPQEHFYSMETTPTPLWR